MAKVRIAPDLTKVFDRIRKDFVKEAKRKMATVIVSTIKKGTSPVKGHGRYRQYSESYRRAMLGRNPRYPDKKPRPVNLTLTGRMLKSIKSRQTKGGITIWFTDEKAKWHNEGTSRMPARRMLPIGGESLSKAVEKRIKNMVTDIVKKGFR